MRQLTVYRPTRASDGYGGSVEQFTDAFAVQGTIARDRERTVLLVRREVELLPGYFVLDGVHADWALASRSLYRVSEQIEEYGNFGWKRAEIEKVEKPLSPGV